jgi:hypothetical protein
MSMLWRTLSVLFVGVLLSCTTKPVDPRQPTEIVAPSLEDWRAAAGDLAAKIAQDATAHPQTGLATLAPVEGDVPPYFNDLFLASLIGRGMRIAQLADGNDGTLHITCRATPSEITPYPRGLTVPPTKSPAELLVFCLLAHQGVYIAAQRHALPTTYPPRPPRGVVIEIKG